MGRPASTTAGFSLTAACWLKLTLQHLTQAPCKLASNCLFRLLPNTFLLVYLQQLGTPWGSPNPWCSFTLCLARPPFCLIASSSLRVHLRCHPQKPPFTLLQAAITPLEALDACRHSSRCRPGLWRGVCPQGQCCPSGRAHLRTAC